MVAVASAVYSSISSDESHLLDLARQGDALAFMQLFKRHQPMLRRMCATKLHLSDDETDDVLQETSIKGLANILQFENKSQFSSWLYRIAKNTGLTYLNSRAGRARDFPSFDDEDQAVALQQEPATQTEIDPVLLMLQQEDDDRFARLYVAVSKQSPDFREVVNRKLRGEEEETIANGLGLKHGTVKSRFFRATEDLEKRYAQTTVENIPAEDTLFGLFMQQCFEGSDEDRKELLGIWREEKCQAPLSEADIIERARALNPLIGTPEFKGNDHLRPEARNALNRLELCLLLGWRGLPGGQNFEHLFYKNKITSDRPALSEMFILINSLKYYLLKKKLPNQYSGSVPDLADESWANWQAVALHRGQRGLTEKGMTLKKLYIKYGMRLDTLTEETIIEQGLDYLKNNGVFPGEHAGQFGKYLDETWHGVFVAATLKRRNLSRSMSVPQLFQEYICNQAVKHINIKNEKPGRNSGPLPDHPDITWEMIEDAVLNRGGGHACKLEKYLESVPFVAAPIPTKFVRLQTSVPVALYSLTDRALSHIHPAPLSKAPVLNMHWGAKDVEHHHRPPAAVPNRGEETPDDEGVWSYIFPGVLKPA